MMKIIKQYDPTTTYVVGGTVEVDGTFRTILEEPIVKGNTVQLRVSVEGASESTIAKQVTYRQKIANMTVTYNGMVFSATDNSQSRMHRVADAMDKGGVLTTLWALKEPFNGQAEVEVTSGDLRQVMALGLLELKKIVITQGV